MHDAPQIVPRIPQRELRDDDDELAHAAYSLLSQHKYAIKPRRAAGASVGSSSAVEEMGLWFTLRPELHKNVCAPYFLCNKQTGCAHK